MNISDWLDRKVAEGIDVQPRSHCLTICRMTLSPTRSYFFRFCSPAVSSAQKSPLFHGRALRALVSCRGQDKKAGVHATGMEWTFFTKDKDLAVKTAKSRIE